ncbi:MAG: hypothetical protein AABM67_04395 [Acidobacteriota bacterium]
MRNFRFWLPTAIGTLMAPVFLWAALDSTGAGHGSYDAAIVFYPLSMLILGLFAGVAANDAFATQILQTFSMVIVVGIAVLQFPFYGFVLSYAKLKNSWWLTAVAGIICLHLVGIGVWLVIAGVMWVTSG